MHKMKDEVTMRNLAQESLKSVLRWKRYDEKSFRDLFKISEKWLGLIWKYFWIPGSVWNIVEYGLIL
jgi:hypothetical protein